MEKIQYIYVYPKIDIQRKQGGTLYYVDYVIVKGERVITEEEIFDSRENAEIGKKHIEKMIESKKCF